jgi:tryptophan synthase alpha chain
VNRIKQRFESLRQQGRKALVSYVVMGDPAKDVTLPVMHALVESGTDIIELGIPFSDPNAEGPVIQKAHERALGNGSSLRDALAKVKQFRETDSDTPVLLMGYTNPIERTGYDSFIEQAVDAGIDAVLTVDLPPEEAEEFNEHLRQANIENIFLLAPTSGPDRQKKVTDMAGGFIYYVSLKGVTGAGNLDLNSVDENVTSIRSLTDLPVCVGFGIKDGASARAVADLSDGVVIGSVLVNQIAMLADQGVSDPSVYASAISEIITEIRQALDH